MKTRKFIIIYLISSIACYHAYTQESDRYLIENTNKKGIPTFLKFDIRSHQITNALDIFSEDIIPRDIDEFRKVKTTTRINKSGDVLKNEKYQQYYNGIKVEQGFYCLHYKNDIVYSLNGMYLDNINIDHIPKIGNEVALSSALNHVNAERYYWDVNDTLDMPVGELVIIESDTVENQYYLAYRYIICAVKPYSTDLIYVDANDGSIIRKQSLILNDYPSSGPANTIYSGEQTIYTKFDQSQEEYKLLDPSRDIHTYDNQNDDERNPHEFYDDDNFWTESPEWDNESGLDAHWATYITYEYLDDVIGINSYDDNGGKIDLYVHWGEGWENAETYPYLKYIAFGDGGTESGTSEWVSLDIVAHEIGHLITYYKDIGSGTQYSIQRAIVEGFSDIWAICVEWNYINNIQQDQNKEPYNQGEQICTSDNFVRSNSNPNSEGLDGFRGADTYQGTYWDYDPAYSMSTVISHWFYIFMEGRTDTTDFGNYFSVEGINDPLEGSRILYNVCGDDRIEGDYITFQIVKEQIIDLVQTEYGHLDNKTLNAIQAWYAVGVPGSCLTQCWNETFSSDFHLYVPGCNINVDNVTITGSGTDVVFEADEITIESDFEVAPGATLEIINP